MIIVIMHMIAVGVVGVPEPPGMMMIMVVASLSTSRRLTRMFGDGRRKR